jgi:NADH dehydrogenase [ubiquinone] 1 alpha subcomplex assembly factor 7
LSPARPGALLALLQDLIRLEGPIGLDRYMALALGHPTHGYYMTRDPFGRAGDFTTAPEISQMFGEMLGLWAAEAWRQMGSPGTLRLVELGPGRGTLMADLLRAARTVPEFRAALDLHLVETSPVLRDAQAAALAQAGVPHRWHDRIDSVPDGPTLVLANEVFDALPVRHFVRTERGWCERLVGLGPDGALAFGLSPLPEAGLSLKAPVGAMLELGAEGLGVMRAIARRIAGQGGAALILDYGHAASGFGETLQALQAHRFADPLAAPGEADLTTHVDFAALARTARQEGAAAHGPVTQGAFLLGLGIAARAAQLSASRPDQAGAIEAALQRLTGPGTPDQPGMGELFKVLAITAPGSPVPAGFDPPPQIDPASTM